LLFKITRNVQQISGLFFCIVALWHVKHETMRGGVCGRGVSCIERQTFQTLTTSYKVQNDIKFRNLFSSPTCRVHFVRRRAAARFCPSYSRCSGIRSSRYLLLHGTESKIPTRDPRVREVEGSSATGRKTKFFCSSVKVLTSCRRPNCHKSK
jgi:hypothetical protein